MMVMMMAITPSENASRRAVLTSTAVVCRSLIGRLQRFIRACVREPWRLSTRSPRSSSRADLRDGVAGPGPVVRQVGGDGRGDQIEIGQRLRRRRKALVGLLG